MQGLSSAVLAPSAEPRPIFCSAAACQRERRRRSQAAKRQSDPDYRENQKRAQKAWAERHPDYWRAYRDQHPEYVARKRARHRERAPAPAAVAKMDASKAEILLRSGTYRVSPVADGKYSVNP